MALGTALSPESEPELACIVPLGPESEPELRARSRHDLQHTISERSCSCFFTVGQRSPIDHSRLQKIFAARFHATIVVCSMLKRRPDQLRTSSIRPHHHTPSQIKDNLGAGTLLRHGELSEHRGKTPITTTTTTGKKLPSFIETAYIWHPVETLPNSEVSYSSREPSMDTRGARSYPVDWRRNFGTTGKCHRRNARRAHAGK
ncbi:hypothetical protein EDB86DRAFT_1384223 [Lactarius hatsudake]|nr:hypothetical protein EDB86DRAFT_1384223 [Lactarius hatsudake]